MHKKYVVTGKIGSGKSSFIDILKTLDKYNFRSADIDSKRIISDNINIIKEIVFELYGKDIDYKELFFKDKILKDRIEQYVHTKLYEEYRDLKLDRDIFLEIPLYFETKRLADKVGFTPYKIIYIDVNKNIRYNRLMQSRNMSVDQIDEREKYFVSDEVARSKSDIIIKNDDDYKKLKERTLKYFA